MRLAGRAVKYRSSHYGSRDLREGTSSNFYEYDRPNSVQFNFKNLKEYTFKTEDEHRVWTPPAVLWYPSPEGQHSTGKPLPFNGIYQRLSPAPESAKPEMNP